jgi:hypothetical protein
MSPLQRWFERQFIFDLPLSRFPNVVERLRGSPARLEERVRSLPPATLTARFQDTWSIQENDEAHHNAAPLNDLLEEFSSLRFRFVTVLEGADASALERTARHPRLGTPMRCIDIAFFTAEHDDHHLARITELMNQL